MGVNILRDHFDLSLAFKPPESGMAVQRSGLYSLADNKKVVFVEGKRGQGKSKFVHEYLKQSSSDFLWYNVTKTDGFFENILKAITGKIIDNEENAETEDSDGFRRAISRILSPFVFVFDNYDNIEINEQQTALLEQTVKQTEPNIRFIFISAIKTPPGLDMLYPRDKLRIITEEQLSFNSEDTKRLADLYKLALKKRTLSRIVSINEGWITGIIYYFEKLSEQSSSGKKKISFHDDVFYYRELEQLAADSIFSKINEEEKEILVMLGCCRTFPKDLLIKLHGQDGVIFLEEMVRENLFVSLRQIKGSDYYHFHKYLETYLRRDFFYLPIEKRRQILESITCYYESKNLGYQVIRYSLLNEEKDKALELFSAYGDRLFEKNRISKIRKTVRLFIQSGFADEPVVRYYRNITNIFYTPRRSSKELLSLLPYFKETEQDVKVGSIFAVLLASYFFYQENKSEMGALVEDAEKFIAEVKGLPPDKLDVIKALIPLGRCWLNQEDREAINMALKAEELSIENNDEEALIYSRVALSRMYLLRGLFENAENLLQSTYESLSPGGYSSTLKSIVSFYLGDSFFYQGKLDEAIVIAEEALNKGDKYLDFSYYLQSNLCFYYLYKKDFSTVKSILPQLQKKTNYKENHYALYAILSITMLTAYRENNRRKVEYYLEKLCRKENEYLLKTYYPSSYLDIIEMYIFLGNTDKALSIAISTLKKLVQKNYSYTWTTMNAFAGYICYLKGRHKEAAVYFEKMEAGIVNNNFMNLYIVSPELLNKIAVASRSPKFLRFYRIESEFSQQLSMNHSLWIQTLGGFKLYFNGEEIPVKSISSMSKVRDLFLLMLVYKESGVKKTLVHDLLWFGYPYEAARDNLNTTVCRLRKIIDPDGEIVVSGTNHLELNKSMIVIDTDIFVKKLEEARIAEKRGDISRAVKHYQDAILYYKGEYLDEYNHIDVINSERDYFYNKQKQAIFNLSRIYLLEKKYPEAYEGLSQLVKMDRICEPAYRLLMFCFAAIGNRAEIARLFEKLNTNLMKEINLSADRKTVELRNRLFSEETLSFELVRDEMLL